MELHHLTKHLTGFGQWPKALGVALAALAALTVIGLIGFGVLAGDDNGTGDSEVATEPTSGSTMVDSTDGSSGATTGIPSRFDPREPGEVFALVELDDGSRVAGFGSPLVEPVEVPATTRAAVPDGRGGVVYSTGNELWWQPASATEPTLLDDSDRRVLLVGLRHVGEEPLVLALIDDELIGYDQGKRRFAGTFDSFAGEIGDLAIDGEDAVATVLSGDGATAVESVSLSTGERHEIAPSTYAEEVDAPLAVAVSNGRIVILRRSSGPVVLTSDGAETATVDLGIDARDVFSIDLAADRVLVAFGEAALAIDIVSGEREVMATPTGRVLGAVWADADLGSRPLAANEATRFRVDTEKVRADTSDPFLNVRSNPGADGEILAKLPPTYTGLLWTGGQQTVADGTAWYEVELLDPVRITPADPLHGATPTGWVASSFIIALPEGLPVSLDEIEGCAGSHEPIGQGAGSRQPGNVYALESSLLSPRCLRVVVTFGTGTAPFTMAEAARDLAPADTLPLVREYQSGDGGAIVDLGGIQSAWPAATETSDGVYLVRQPDRSLQLWSPHPVDGVTVKGFSERGIVVIDLTLDPDRSVPRAGRSVVLTQQPLVSAGSVQVTGIARPFEALLDTRIEDASGAPVEAIFSGSLRLGTIRTSEYGVETTDWAEAWSSFALLAEGLAPGEYTMVLDAEASGDRSRSLRIPFTITEPGSPPALASNEELKAVQALVGFARGSTVAGSVPLADEVILGLGLVETTTMTRDQLADSDAWVSEESTFAGFDGEFSALSTLAHSGPVRITTGPIPHCAGPPRDWPAELDGLDQVNIEPVGIDSCISWYGVSVFLDSSGQIAGVVLDLFGP